MEANNPQTEMLAEIDIGIDILKQRDELVHFDKAFFAQLNQHHYQGMPLGDYLQVNQYGQCLDCSALLAVALNGTQADEPYVCRGILERLNGAFKRKFNHGWVEQGNQVYDTTWQIKVNRDAYYNLFGVRLQKAIPVSEYCAEGSVGERYRLDPDPTTTADLDSSLTK